MSTYIYCKHIYNFSPFLLYFGLVWEECDCTESWGGCIMEETGYVINISNWGLWNEFIVYVTAEIFTRWVLSMCFSANKWKTRHSWNSTLSYMVSEVWGGSTSIWEEFHCPLPSHTAKDSSLYTVSNWLEKDNFWNIGVWVLQITSCQNLAHCGSLMAKIMEKISYK